MSILSAFPSRVRSRIAEQRPLAPLTTLRVGGNAQFYLEARGLRDVCDALEACRAANMPLHVIGGGSNLLIADTGVPGLVLNLKQMKGVEVFGQKVLVQAGAALNTLVATCAGAGIAGPEGLAGIPGSVGGALAMNAGGRYAEIGRFVDCVTWITPENRVQYLYREEIDFQYRHSSLTRGIVLQAVIGGATGNAAQLKERARCIHAEKLAVQPYSAHSAGCAFKNPKGQSAGKLIDLAGCKGLQVGSARVSEQHGNFVVNLGGATADDVTGLMSLVKERVRTAHGVELSPEVQIWPRVAA
ncbi:MAG: UDP-N-acetylmuramate dehydrogenase [Planctomycetes bacterium]|nr:UDP-N-acetylmuramate dehydrogenase [Planctomycetota bacterium]